MRAGAVGRERVVQAEREREVPEVVGRELQLPALGRARLGRRHHAGVVDEHVQGPVQAATKAATDARSARSRCSRAHVGIAGRFDDLAGRALAGGEVAHRERHVGSRARQRTRRLDSDPGRAAGDDDAATAEVDAACYFRSRRVVSVLRADDRHAEPLVVP